MAAHLDIDGQIATITIDRPEACNAIDQPTAHAISVLLGNADADPRVGAILITGSGGCFCAGIDVEAYARGELFHSPTNGFAGVTKRVLKKPLIGAVEGDALGGGFEIALACDLIVAAEEARFGLGEIRPGLAPEPGALARMSRQLPPRIAAELIMAGRIVSSTVLATYGFVNRVVPRGEALSSARALATKIVAHDASVIEMGKRLFSENPSR
jgi:enoyl-CoA hydratase/carnithine racemase